MKFFWKQWIHQDSDSVSESHDLIAARFVKLCLWKPQMGTLLPASSLWVFFLCQSLWGLHGDKDNVLLLEEFAI